MKTDRNSSAFSFSRAVWTLAAAFLLAPAATTFAQQVKFANTAVSGLPMYYPSVGFDFSAWSNVHYDHTANLVTVDGTTTFVTRPDGSDQPIKGNLLQVGNIGAATFGRASIRVNVNNQGVLAPQTAHDACGNSSNEDFCVVGYVTDSLGNVLVSAGTDALGQPIPGVLLSGKVTSFGSTRNHPFLFSLSTNKTCAVGDGDPQCFYFDAFEFLVNLDGGLLKNSTDYPGGMVAIEVASIRAYPDGTMGQTHCDTVCEPVTTFTGFFNTDFTGYNIDGSAAATDPVGFGTDLCNGTIQGSVKDLFGNPMSSVDVSLTGGFLGAALKTQSAADGSYAFPGLCATNGYSVVAGTPTGYNATDGFPTTVAAAINFAMPVDTSTPAAVNFQFSPITIITTAFTTYSQAEWGGRPNGKNAAYYLATYFNLAEPDGNVVIGGPKTVTMTGATPVKNFLPQGGLPLALDKNYVDPPSQNGQFKPHMRLGSLAGETLALQLNVDFSNASLTRPGLINLHLVSGPFAGQTVGYVLGVANCLLGGGTIASCGVPAAIANVITYLGPKLTLLVKYDAVEDTVEKINKNFLGGTVDRGFLKP